MRRIVIGMMLCFAMAAPAANAWAGVRAETFEVGAFFGGVLFDGSEYIESPDPFNGDFLGARVAYHFTKNWAAEFCYERLETNWQYPFSLFSSNIEWQELSFDIFRFDALYHILSGRFAPYVAAGAGGAYQDQEWPGPSETKLLLNYGGGLKVFLTEDFLLRGDVRHVFILDTPKNNIEFSIGIGYLLGAKPLGDADLDGVKDKVDQCPDTPLGVTVDEKGCPLDEDGDGIPDFRDQCPDVPGVPENYGCPIGYGDDDGDGVLNDEDECPDTPEGALVDSVGCPLDSDGDGIYDGLDLCPETPAGTEVGPDGCPLAPAEPEEEPVTAEIGLTPEALEALRREIEPVQIRFDFDSSTIKADFTPFLDHIAGLLQSHPGARIELGGHASAEGTETYNQKLSERRAAAVYDYLVEHGIPEESLSSIGHGESKPLASNETLEGRAKNRRVEFKVLE